MRGAKAFLFITLTVLAAVLGVHALRTDPGFGPQFWSNAFWLVAAVVATTFLVDTILERSAAARERRRDEFAYRSFTATAFAWLFDVAGLGLDHPELMSSAIAGNPALASATKNAAAAIASNERLNWSSYNTHYLDLASHLRSLSTGFIRLFAKTDSQMLERYTALQQLASRWVYQDVLSPQSVEYRESLDPTDPRRAPLDNQFAAVHQTVQSLVAETARYLAELAAVV